MLLNTISTYCAIWCVAIRPKTLSLSFVPIAVGTCLATSSLHSIDWSICFCALLTSLFIQIATNLINDALDFQKGVDDTNRLGPPRAAQLKLLSVSQLLLASFLFLGGAIILGIPLIIKGGWLFAAILALSLLCSYLYTGGPIPLAYIGLGEVFVLIFFGLVATCSAYYLQTLSLSLSSLMAGMQIGLLAIVPLSINNLRDYATDKQMQKRTLIVRFGLLFGRLEITLATFAPFLIGFYWLLEGKTFMTLLPLLLFSYAYHNVHSIWKLAPSSTYNVFLTKSAFFQLLFGAFLIIGHFLS